MKQKLFLFLLIFQCLINAASAQVNSDSVKKHTKANIDSLKNTDHTLNGQYVFMLSRSKSINGYKLINPLRLSGFWKSVSDTLNKNRAELLKSKEKNIEQEKTITYLKTEVNGKENSLNEVSLKENEIDFIGFSLPKTTYHTTVWAIIGLLTVAIIIVVIRSKKSIVEAKHRTQLYEEITNEFQTYKIKATEKERKLARELQDERNLLEEIKSHNKAN